MKAFMVILGLAIITGQVFAIVVCFQNNPARWMKIFGGIGAILTLLALFGSY